MEEPLRYLPPNSTANQEQRRLQTLTLGLTAFWLIFEFLPLTARGAIIEEEISLRDIGFYVPDEVDKAKRRTAQESGFSLLNGVGVVWGAEDNIYRSPSDLEESGELWSGWAYLRADKRFGERERLMSTLTWQQTRYPGHSNTNSDRGHLSNWYTRPLTDNTRIEFDLDIYYKSDDATTIRGERYERDYAYWRYTTEGLFVWNMSKEHRFKIGGEYLFKDYDETSGLNTLDWAQRIFKVRYRYRFARYHYLRVWYSLSERKYEEELASLCDSDGTELVSNPDEKHRYQRIQVWYSVPINDKLDLDLKYNYRTKKDLFKDYESYNSHKIEARVRLKATEKMEIRMEAGYTIRDYDNILGDRDKSHELEYTKWNLGVGAQYKLRDSCWIFGKLSYYDRESNKNYGNLYRSYTGLFLSTGISFFF